MATSSYPKVANKKANAVSLFITYLLRAYYMSETTPGTTYVAGTKQTKIPSLAKVKERLTERRKFSQDLKEGKLGPTWLCV